MAAAQGPAVKITQVIIWVVVVVEALEVREALVLIAQMVALHKVQVLLVALLLA
jgi:hypothetical protein